MTQPEKSDSAAAAIPWKAWPRTVEGYCSCPYCTAAREGRLPPIHADARSEWSRRMGSPR